MGNEASQREFDSLPTQEILVLGMPTKIFFKPSSKAFGYCHATGAIQLDPRLDPTEFAQTLCHEMLHRAAYQVFSEEFVEEFSIDLFHALQQLGFKVVKHDS